MRVNTKKVMQLLLAAFLVFVIYLNVHVTEMGSESARHNRALPWGDDFNLRKRSPSSSSSLSLHDGSKFHQHAGNPPTGSPPAGNVSKVSVEGGQLSENDGALVHPSLERYDDDRIQKQLKYVAESVQRAGEAVTAKKILVYSGTGSWHIPRGSALFKDQQCAVQACELVDDRSRMNEADVVLFQHAPPNTALQGRPLNQAWAIFLLESPYHSASLAGSRGVFNWTATYRHDSTIVAPYEKYIPLNASLLSRPPVKNYALGKTKKVAWFVSNCGARNKRRQYAEELSKYIEVDIYGGCGQLKCPRHQSDKCFGMLNTDYKFYLAFENSNCRDYISEKFFINGLKHDVIPIVMGAAPEDYRRAAPPHSFIHVDEFPSAQELAEYLHRLDQDDTLYNQYFAWKGLWDNINTFFWCRMCAMAHDMDRRGHSWYEDVESWWRGSDVCIGQDTWRQQPPKGRLIAPLPVQSLS